MRLGSIKKRPRPCRSLKLQRWADREREWLDAHPSDPCYALTYTSWTTFVTHYGKMARFYREAIPEDDPAKTLDQADDAWERGDAEWQQVIDTIPISDDACGT